MFDCIKNYFVKKRALKDVNVLIDLYKYIIVNELYCGDMTREEAINQLRECLDIKIKLRTSK